MTNNGTTQQATVMLTGGPGTTAAEYDEAAAFARSAANEQMLELQDAADRNDEAAVDMLTATIAESLASAAWAAAGAKALRSQEQKRHACDGIKGEQWLDALEARAGRDDL